jgi:hypothetical protein
MFFRKQTQFWYVKIDGKFVPLGKDEQEARKKYQSLLPPESNADTDDVRSLTSAYLDYLAANRSDGTYKIASRHLTDFATYLEEHLGQRPDLGVLREASDEVKEELQALDKCGRQWTSHLPQW